MIEQSLASRLERLEGQNRRLRRGLAVLALLGGAAIWMAQMPYTPPEVRAQRIVLGNAEGDALIELRGDGGTPSLVLRQDGEVLVELTGLQRRGAIRYRDADGQLRDLAAPMAPRPLSRR